MGPAIGNLSKEPEPSPVPRPSPPRPSKKKGAIRVLSIDGGGMKGLIPALILSHIEKQMGKQCHEIFDVICGTSTGGLMALLLGVLKKPASTVTAMYLKRGQEIFPQSAIPGAKLSAVAIKTRQYANTGLKKVIQELIKDNGAATMMNDSTHASPPRVVLVACKACKDDEGGDRFGFLNFTPKKPLGFSSTSECSLEDAALSTSAAPTYFEPVNIMVNDKEIQLKDGGLVANNPVATAFDVARSEFEGTPIECIVSLGCGQAPDDEGAASHGLSAIMSHIVNMATDTERAHLDMRHGIINSRFSNTKGLTYFRLNPVLTSDIMMDDTTPKTIEKMKNIAADFIAKHELEVVKVDTCGPDGKLTDVDRCPLFACLGKGK